MRMGNQPGFTNQAAHRAAQFHQVSGRVSRSRIISPPPSVLAQVVEELIESPPTDEELQVLTDMGTATETLVEVEAQLEGTRILELLRTLAAKTNISIADCIVILLMIYQTYLMLRPQQPAPPPPPQVNVTVNVPPVPTDEIVKGIEKRLEQEHCAPTPSPGVT